MEHLLFIVEKIAKLYNLDAQALLDKNPKIYYIDIGDNLLEINRETHLSRCISSSSKIAEIFSAIRTLKQIV